MTKESAELWSPPTRAVTLAGETVTVIRLRVRQILALTPLLNERKDLFAAGFTLDDGTVDALIATLPELLEREAPWLIKALAIAADVDEQQLLEAGPDELIDLAQAIAEVNIDFFSERLAPALSRAVGAVAQAGKVTGAGQTRYKR